MIGRTVEAAGQVQHFSPGAGLAADWWRMFKAASINDLVQQAIDHNPSLQAAEASLRQSQDELRAGNGVIYPQIELWASATRERSAPVQQGQSTPGAIFNVVTLGGTISYVLDIFGGERRAVEALKAQTDYQRNLRRAAYLALTANVVNTSIARAAFAAQIRATQQIIDLETVQLHASVSLYQSGMSAYSSVLALRSLIAANQASLAPLRQKNSQAEHLLATLLGAAPSGIKLPEIELSELALPTDLPISLPSDLVRQRPDVLAAEAQLQVASANIGVATAAMFPSFSLSGSYGAAGSRLGNMSAANNRLWTIGPSVNLPIFQGGRLSYARQAAIDAQEQAQALYRQSVLGAFAQVADALQALQQDAAALRAQDEARTAAADALALVQTAYQTGLVAYLDVLAADIQLQQASIAYLQALAQRHQDTVTLFAALGGGWWNSQRHADLGNAQ